MYRKSGQKLLMFVPYSIVRCLIQTCRYEVRHVGLEESIDMLTNVYWSGKGTCFISVEFTISMEGQGIENFKVTILQLCLERTAK